MKTLKRLQAAGFNASDSDSNARLYNALFVLFAMALLVLYLVFQPGLISIDQTQNMVNAYDSRIAAYLVSFLIMLLCALTPLPAEIIAVTNALIFSPVEAFLVTWLSAVTSASVGYELGRLHYFDPCKSENGKICRWLRCHGYKGLIVMRLVPLVPFFALNICAGLFKLNRTKYVLITSVTVTPAVALLTFFPTLFI